MPGNNRKIGLVLVLLLTAVWLLAGAGEAGSQADPLVTKGWVDQYLAAEANRLEQRLDALEEALQKTTTVRLWIGRDYLEIDDGEKKEQRSLDAVAYLGANGRTYVPLRALGEAVGASCQWDNEAKKVTYIKDGRRIVLLVGRSVVQVNGQEIAVDGGPEVKNGRVMVPLRVVTENMGFRLKWDNGAKLAELII